MLMWSGFPYIQQQFSAQLTINVGAWCGGGAAPSGGDMSHGSAWRGVLGARVFLPGLALHPASVSLTSPQQNSATLIKTPPFDQSTQF